MHIFEYGLRFFVALTKTVDFSYYTECSMQLCIDLVPAICYFPLEIEFLLRIY